jgi:hypothetical protein
MVTGKPKTPTSGKKQKKGPSARQRRQGAEAEAHVRRILDQLPKWKFSVFNDIKAKYGNIDHLVIDRSGKIYLIETKSHRGKVTYDGKHLLINGRPFKRNPIAQVARNIKWLRNTIQRECHTRPWITGIIVLTNATMRHTRSTDFNKTRALHIKVLAAETLGKALRSAQAAVFRLNHSSSSSGILCRDFRLQEPEGRHLPSYSKERKRDRQRQHHPC